MNERIAIVEDEDDLRESLKTLLEREEYYVKDFKDGTDALVGIKEEEFDLLLLDWMIPRLSGIELLKIIRNDSNYNTLAVIMVTAKTMEINIVNALNLGADDYIIKPFRREELLARVKAVLRRYKLKEKKESPLLKYGEIWADTSKHKAGDLQKIFNLTPMEFKILVYLIENAGKLFTREQILSQFWEEEKDVDIRAVDVHIARMREKMGNSGKVIETVRGLGYRMKELNESF